MSLHQKKTKVKFLLSYCKINFYQHSVIQKITSSHTIILEGFSSKTVGKANNENSVASANKNSQFYINFHELNNIKLALQPRHGKPVFFFLYRNISVIDSSICKAFDHVPREMIWWALKKKV